MMAGRKNVRHWAREVVVEKTAWRGPTIGLRDGVHVWYDIERLLEAQPESSRAIAGEHCVVETTPRAATRSSERDAWGQKRRLMADSWDARPSANRAEGPTMPGAVGLVAVGVGLGKSRHGGGPVELEEIPEGTHSYPSSVPTPSTFQG
jgi:hypothetical protein